MSGIATDELDPIERLIERGEAAGASNYERFVAGMLKRDPEFRDELRDKLDPLGGDQP